MREQMTDAALASLGSKTTLAGVATTGAGWLMSNMFFSWLGFFVAIVGLMITVHYKRKEDRRREVEHKALLRMLSGMRVSAYHSDKPGA